MALVNKMIKIFSNLEDFKREITQIKRQIDIDSIIKLDFPFFEYEDNFAIINIPYYNSESQNNIALIYKKDIFIYTGINFNNYKKNYKDILNKKYGESTVILLLLIKHIIKNYSQQFEKIRDKMNSLDLNPILDEIEHSGRELRRLTDRLEELLQIIIIIREREIKIFDNQLLSFDYEMLNVECRYWLERCRSHIYRISSLRTKSEMKSNKQLNDTMHRLTIIITFLTIVSIVVSVPGTVGAIFGIPALSEAYFKDYVGILVFALIGITLISVLLGVLYWKSLNLKKR